MEKEDTKTRSPLKKGERRLAGILLILVLVASAAIILLLVRAPERKLVFTMFDVGQGDAIFIETPTKEQMLIDGGPSNTVLEKLGRAMPLGDRTLDAVMLSHPDADHLTGIVAVLTQYHVKTLIVSGSTKTTATYRAFEEVIQEKNIPVRIVRSGDVFHLSSSVSFAVFFPNARWMDAEHEANDTSVLGRLHYKDFSVALTGDASDSEELGLLQMNADLKSTILKVGHHGSRSSSSVPFLDAIDPELALVSLGADNSYGHPHEETLERFRKRGIPILRTDMGSDITVGSDGHTYDVKRGLGFRLW